MAGEVRVKDDGGLGGGTDREHGGWRRRAGGAIRVVRPRRALDRDEVGARRRDARLTARYNAGWAGREKRGEGRGEKKEEKEKSRATSRRERATRFGSLPEWRARRELGGRTRVISSLRADRDGRERRWRRWTACALRPRRQRPASAHWRSSPSFHEARAWRREKTERGKNGAATKRGAADRARRLCGSRDTIGQEANRAQGARRKPCAKAGAWERKRGRRAARSGSKAGGGGKSRERQIEGRGENRERGREQGGEEGKERGTTKGRR